MKPPFNYYGGKQQMLRHILPLIPEHQVYVEPFAGGAAVFWAKEPAPIEVLNDTNHELVNFYEVMQNQYVELADLVKDTLCSRSHYQFASMVYQFPNNFWARAPCLGGLYPLQPGHGGDDWRRLVLRQKA